MKILIISKCPTHPTNAGNRRFILNQIELLIRMGQDVHFLYIEENGFFHKDFCNKNSIQEMESFFGKKFHLLSVGKFQKAVFNIRQRIRAFFSHGYMKCDDYYPIALTSYVRKLNKSEKFDVCIINYYYLSKLYLDCEIPRKAITTHDYFAYKDQLVNVKNVVNNTTAHEEAVALQRCNHIFALNTDEATYFSKLAPRNTVYNVFSTYAISLQPLVCKHDLLFLSGNNVYNVKGLNWFIQEIFPAICRAIPDVKLLIAGSICKKLDDLRKNPNVQLLGYVENEADFYALGDVVINPTYLGTGLKIKTFESLSYGKITMAHPHSIQGVFESKNVPVFVSTKANEWVAFLNQIWENPQKMLDISKRSLNYISQMNQYVEKEYIRFLEA